MTKTVIKDATVNDIPLIRELTFKIWPQTYSPILSEQQIAYMLDMMYSVSALTNQFSQLNHHFIIAYDEGKAVGFASYALAHKNIFKLHKIYVLPNLQGKGIGRSLIYYVVRDIKTKNAIALDLNVNRFNPAKDFYKKLGFVILKEEDIDIGNSYFMNDYVLQLSLT